MGTFLFLVCKCVCMGEGVSGKSHELSEPNWLRQNEVQKHKRL